MIWSKAFHLENSTDFLCGLVYTTSIPWLFPRDHLFRKFKDRTRLDLSGPLLPEHDFYGGRKNLRFIKELKEIYHCVCENAT